jgi:nitroimidazol reductase NimA-like FMN-containing flavoprotein (pyridoxamine 5'-phosphate oxidase superfamily)
MPIVKLPRMTRAEIDAVIQRQMLCRIAFRGDDYPYIAPFQYVSINGRLYVHFSGYGKKLQLLKRDDRVCVEIEEYTRDLSEYRFVSMRGTLRAVTDPQERAAVARRMADAGRQNLSLNFLAVHGFEDNDGWSAFTVEQDLILLRLDDVTQVFGLKSP